MPASVSSIDRARLDQTWRLVQNDNRTCHTAVVSRRDGRLGADCQDHTRTLNRQLSDLVSDGGGNNVCATVKVP